MRLMTVLLFLALPLSAFEVLDNAAVVRMVGAGLGTDVIVLKIERSEASFDTTTDSLIALKNAHVPDAVIRAMLIKGDAVPPSPAPRIAPPIPAPPAPPGSGDNICANVKFYTTGNEGPAWVPSNVCVGPNSVSVDEQPIPLADVAVQCTSKPGILAMGGSLLRGDQEWWISDAKETLKFRGKQEDLDRLAAALKQSRRDIPSGSCSDREVRKRLVRP